jgi:hypothetical protein
MGAATLAFRAAPIPVAPAAGGAVGGAAEGLQGPAAADPRHHLGRRQHRLGPPAVAIAHVHELDQAQLHPPLPRQRRQGQQLVVVAAPLDHGVELELALRRIEPRRPRLLDRRQHLRQQRFPRRWPTRQPRHRRHRRPIGAIEAEGEAIEPGGA